MNIEASSISKDGKWEVENDGDTFILWYHKENGKGGLISTSVEDLSSDTLNNLAELIRGGYSYDRY